MAIVVRGSTVWAHHMVRERHVQRGGVPLMIPRDADRGGRRGSRSSRGPTLWRVRDPLLRPMLFALRFITMFPLAGFTGSSSPSSPFRHPTCRTRLVGGPTSLRLLFGGSVFTIFFFRRHLPLVPRIRAVCTTRPGHLDTSGSLVFFFRPSTFRPMSPSSIDGMAAPGWPHYAIRRDAERDHLDLELPGSACVLVFPPATTSRLV